MALGPRTRTVRCTICGHTWQQAPPFELPRHVDLRQPVAEKPTTADMRAAWQNPGLISVGLLFLLGLLFGLIFVLNRLATTNGVPFIPYVFWQSLGAAVILLVFCGALRQLPKLGFAHLRIYFITGTLSMVVPFSIFSFVAPKVPAGLLSVGLTLTPTLIYILALPFGLDRFGWVRVLGILLGLVGVLFLLIPETSLPSPDMVGWVALGLIPPLGFAVNNILIALLRPPATTSLRLSLGLLVAGTLLFIPVLLASGSWWFFDGPFGIGHWAVLGAIANNSVIFIIMFEIIRRAGPVFFSTVNYIAPLAGVGFGILIFQDSHSMWIWAALVLLFAGLFFVNMTGLITRKATAQRSNA